MDEAAPLTGATILPARHKLDVHAYYALAKAGILGRDNRVELIGGDIIDMAPIGHDHAGTTNRLAEALVLACQGRATVSVQNPVRLDRFNEPQPDFAVLRRREDFYGAAHPGPADVLLLIEVSDTTLRFDRTVKLRLYGQAGIPEYWIVDLNRRVVAVHRRPTADGYDEVSTKGMGERLALAMAPEIVVVLDGAPGV